MKKRVIAIALIFFVIGIMFFSISVYAAKGGVSANQEKARVESGNGGGKVLKTESSEIKSNVEIGEVKEGQIKKIEAKLSNGNNQEIKIMPKRASETASEVLASKNIIIELKEAKTKTGSRVVYDARAEKNSKILGLFKKKMIIETQLDAETGELVKFKKPWWAFLATGEDNGALSKKLTLCHIPPGNPSNAHTISVGRPAARAHLAHGDYLGTCESGNDTDQNDTNQTSNLTLIIESPKNITYNTTDILVNISSNGELILFSINNNTNETYNVSVIRTFLNGTNTVSAFANNSLGNELSASVVFYVGIETNITIPQNNTNVTENNTNSS